MTIPTHLIEGCKLAIANGPGFSQNIMSSNEVKLWTKQWTNSLYKALEHYEKGGTIQDRP